MHVPPWTGRTPVHVPMHVPPWTGRTPVYVPMHVPPWTARTPVHVPMHVPPWTGRTPVHHPLLSLPPRGHRSRVPRLPGTCAGSVTLYGGTRTFPAPACAGTPTLIGVPVFQNATVVPTAGTLSSPDRQSVAVSTFGQLLVSAQVFLTASPPALVNVFLLWVPQGGGVEVVQLAQMTAGAAVSSTSFNAPYTATTAGSLWLTACAAPPAAVATHPGTSLVVTC